MIGMPMVGDQPPRTFTCVEAVKASSRLSLRRSSYSAAAATTTAAAAAAVTANQLLTIRARMLADRSGRARTEQRFGDLVVVADVTEERVVLVAVGPVRLLRAERV